MARRIEFDAVADSVARLWSAPCPGYVHYDEIRKLGPGLEQLYVSSGSFNMNIDDHCRALLEELPKMIGELRAALFFRRVEKFYSLELPEGVSDARSIGPVRMVSVRYDYLGHWVTRFDVIFEKATNG